MARILASVNTIKAKVLVVDDRPENIFAMQKLLEPLDIEVFTAETGNSALALMLHHDFAVALIDVQMPEMDGFELATLMRENEVTEDIPIIFLTAISKEEKYIFKGYDVGAVDYLVKPVDPVMVRSKVSVFCQLYLQQVELKMEIARSRELEENLQQAQKMEAIGTLAGGIAHDFNNILGGILGYTELAQDDTAQDSPVQEYLAEILKSTTRAKELVKQILTFSRKSQEQRKPVRVHQIVKEVVKLIRSTIPSTIEIIQKIDEQSGLAIADPTQIHQIVMNLCTNAGYAMQDHGGKLEIHLSPVVLAEKDLEKYHDLKTGPYLKLIISDTGSGIDSSILPRIFEPFFTTKEKEKGTGMGLAVVHGIIKSYNGDIIVESQAGKGSIFTVLLPRVIAEIEKKEEPMTTIPKGNERILFVDDEETLMDLGKKMLQSLGYTVITCNSSLEALEMFEQQSDKFDLVITDQTMPHLSGYDLAQKMLAIRNSLSVILCTGYSDSVTPDKAKAAGIQALIYKPISRKDIAEKIREVLDKHNHDQP